ncbi:MAG: class I SAM-dependent methyltransferase [Hyphomicrobiales bacterium]|nr:class I SAM-dependent methyltransferase [Hyphomicrobiales bacterium]
MTFLPAGLRSFLARTAARLRPFSGAVTSNRERYALAYVDDPSSRANRVAQEDDLIAASLSGRLFSRGTRPVIRWIKGDGLDDLVTRAALAQATRLFGSAVDYCLCTNQIAAGRVREILAFATQPVEWWPLNADDNPILAGLLDSAGCPPDRFGYWWKWFPERARPDGPEWILDGDMVIVRAPPWMDAWLAGRDVCRMTQDDRWPAEGLYGSYLEFVDQERRLYSGLVSLPPGLKYMSAIEFVMTTKPLRPDHDGREDMCEQGVVATAFARIGAVPIPLCEFPFGRAFESKLDFGLRGDQGTAWGYHFGHAFRRDNPHFHRLVDQGVVFDCGRSPSLVERFAWLGGCGQWGVPGWSMTDGCASVILDYARRFRQRSVLELGTSRGHLTAMLASLGCRVTTIDRHDRGASRNLAGLGVEVIVADALDYLAQTSRCFDLIIVDLHGNSVSDWQRRAPLLLPRLSRLGSLLVSNALLWQIAEWREETGVCWFLDNLPPRWRYRIRGEHPPGVAIVTRG